MSSSPSNTNRLHPTSDQDRGIVHVGDSRLNEALGRLLAIDGRIDPDHVHRFREFARENSIGLDHCWGRLDASGRISQTVLAIINPGRTAMVFASHPQEGNEIAALGELIDHAAGMLAESDVRLGQALLQPEESLERRAFIEGGFSELAMLSYRERTVPRPDEIPAPEWPSQVTIEPYRDSLIRDFMTALDRTYEHTHDCPELRGLRDTSDILDGHRGTGEFDPGLWTLMRIDNDPKGLILLNPSPAQKTIELVYFGLAVDSRGKGLGRALLRHGLHTITGREERMVNLAVDERNAPALRLYAREGFRRSLRRIALIRPMRGANRL